MMIKVVSDWFDYVYYRSSLTYRFFKDDGNLSPTMVVSLIKTIFIIDVGALLFYMFTDQVFIDSHLGGGGVAAGILALLILLLDYNRYKGKFEALHEKWKDELNSTRSLKGFLVFLTFIAPWSPLIIRFIMNDDK